MPKVSQHHLTARRRQILAGARRAFARHGYEGATVRVLEQETGLSRGAIFHHFADKESLFLALAEEDAAEMAAVVAQHGLVQVMRDLPERDAGWLGTQLEVSRRLRTDPGFRARWEQHSAGIATAVEDRLARGQRTGRVRTDVPVEQLRVFLTLVMDGLVAHRAMGLPDTDVEAVLDLVEDSVRRTPAGRRPARAGRMTNEPTPTGGTGGERR